MERVVGESLEGIEYRSCKRNIVSEMTVESEITEVVCAFILCNEKDNLAINDCINEITRVDVGRQRRVFESLLVFVATEYKFGVTDLDIA